jgi:hypothetical protein
MFLSGVATAVFFRFLCCLAAWFSFRVGPSGPVETAASEQGVSYSRRWTGPNHGPYLSQSHLSGLPAIVE